MEQAIKILKKYLKQKSTWVGISGLLTYLGISVGTPVVASASGVVLSLILLYETLREEKTE